MKQYFLRLAPAWPLPAVPEYGGKILAAKAGAAYLRATQATALRSMWW